jgi:hypothetical protein
VRSDTPSTFAHLHPVSSDSVTFSSGLGPLPAARYRVYADVVHETGLTQTMVAEVDAPGPAPADTALGDGDDAVFSGAASGATVTLSDGSSISWLNKPDTLVANEDARLEFAVRESDGSLARLAPYLGMPAHAVVYRTDGQVYIHLHPNGTISTVAQLALGSRLPTDTARGMLARRLSDDTTMRHQSHQLYDGTFAFPYAFPSPGAYRVWVQFRRGDRIATAPFDVHVR